MDSQKLKEAHEDNVKLGCLPPGIQRNAFDYPSAWRGLENVVCEWIRKIGGVNVIVELGVDKGYSLMKLAGMFPEAKVFGVDSWMYDDGQEGRSHVLRHSASYPNVSIITGDTLETAKVFNLPIDVLHIDAGHSYGEVKADYEAWAPKVRDGGLIMMHDINSFPNDVGKFFNELQGHKFRFEECSGLGGIIKGNRGMPRSRDELIGYAANLKAKLVNRAARLSELRVAIDNTEFGVVKRARAGRFETMQDELAEGMRLQSRDRAYFATLRWVLGLTTDIDEDDLGLDT